MTTATFLPENRLGGSAIEPREESLREEPTQRLRSVLRNRFEDVLRPIKTCSIDIDNRKIRYVPYLFYTGVTDTCHLIPA